MKGKPYMNTEITTKKKINLFSSLCIIGMLFIYFIFRILSKIGIDRALIFFSIAGLIYAIFIILREFLKKGKYRTFFSYSLALLLLIFIIILFNQIASNSESDNLFLIAIVMYAVAFILIVLSFSHFIKEKQKKTRGIALFFVLLSVALTIVNIIKYNSWNSEITNIYFIITFICMINSIGEAFIRFFSIKSLSFFERNYLVSGLASMLLLFLIF